MREAPSVKLISLGDSRTGKSCLIKRFCEKRFVSKYMQTIGIDYGTTQVYAKKSDGKTQPLKLHIFDTGGHDCFKQIREEFYVDSQAVLMTFSLDNKQSFTNLKDYWMKELENNIDEHRRDNLIIVIVATKSDSASLEVKSDEARTWVESKAGWKYFETSSQSGQNVAECFDYRLGLRKFKSPFLAKIEFYSNINHLNSDKFSFQAYHSSQKSVQPWPLFLE